MSSVPRGRALSLLVLLLVHRAHRALAEVLRAAGREAEAAATRRRFAALALPVA